MKKNKYQGTTASRYFFWDTAKSGVRYYKEYIKDLINKKKYEKGK